MNLADLGLTKEDLAERVIERISDHLLGTGGRHLTEDGDSEYFTGDEFRQKLDRRIVARADEVIDALAQKHLLPNVTAYVENLTLAETNKWGEKQKKPVTFIEYLVARAEAYLTEKVNYDGKSQRDGDSYNWRGEQTRITHLVEKHLHYSIKTAMEDALKTANAAIVGGIEQAVKMKLAEVQAGLQVSVKTK